MNVLFLVTAYPRAPGDLITPWLVETIRRLGRRGVHVEVLAPSYRGSTDQVVEGVRVHRFRYAPAGWETLTHDQTAPDRLRERPWLAALLPGYVAAGSRAAARLTRGGRFQAVHAFWPLPHGVLGLAAKRASGTPLICTFFGVELTWMESQLPFLRPVLRRVVAGSDAVTAISGYTAAALRRSVPGAQVERIPFGATVEAPAEVSAPFPDPAAPMRLLFVGRLVERKGVHVLLDALARSAGEGAPVLRVLGDGPERAALEARARRLGLGERVHFAGFVAGAELERSIHDADALVLPAVYDRKGDVEGLGVVLIEAMAYGRPGIGSDAGGIPDIVRPGETGLLVPPGDAAALAAAIAELDSDRERARRMGEAARRWVLSEFGWDSIVDRLVGLYRSVGARG